MRSLGTHSCVDGTRSYQTLRLSNSRTAPRCDSTLAFPVVRSPEEHEQIVSTFTRYGLATDANEPGAQQHRVKVVLIDPAKGTPAGYVAKYVAKNVDGAHLNQDLNGIAAPTAAQRTEAWSRLWGIRQFQQIGGPPVTIWRELRRIRERIDLDIEPARSAANSANWAAFVLVMGGVGIPRAQLAIGLIKLPASQLENDESAPSVFLLVRLTGALVDTRRHTWTMQAGADRGTGPPRVPALDLYQ